MSSEHAVARVYVAGPMTGIPAFNFPAFDAAAAALRAQGFDVVSPAELDDEVDSAMARASVDGHIGSVAKTWGDFLARDVKLLADDGITAIVVLPGWEKSRGARLETFVGNRLCGMPILAISYAGDTAVLNTVPELDLFRGWCAEPDLAIAHKWLPAGGAV
jgi:hypothetical protein